MIDLEHLKALCEKAIPCYPMPLQEEEQPNPENGFTCPLCESCGEVDHVDEFLSKDRAVGLQVFGIGSVIDDVESFIIAVNPETILKLLSIIEIQGKALRFAEERLFLATLRCDCCDEGVDEAPCTCTDYSLSEEAHEVLERARESLTTIKKILGEG